MAPLNPTPSIPPAYLLPRATLVPRATLDNDWRNATTPQEAIVVESWSEGYMFGALFIMAGITIANMRSKRILHKLIRVELVFASLQGTFCFFDFTGYGWYLSSTAAFLYISYWLHNVIAWMKIKPFLTKTGSRWYIGTVCLVSPCLVFQIYNNFRYFNNESDLYLKVRPYEALMRDPWWVATTIYLVYIVRNLYGISFSQLFRHGPRFGMMLISMFLSIVFIVVDVCSSTIPHFSSTVGINPYWKFALVFKCFCDTIILDDFKTALEKLRRGVFDTCETIQFDDGEDAGAGGKNRRMGVDRGRHKMSTAISPTRTPRKKSWAIPRFGSGSISSEDANHLENATTSDRSYESALTLNEADTIKEEMEMEVEPQSHNGRMHQAREAIGRVGVKLTHLPHLQLSNLGTSTLKGSRLRLEKTNSTPAGSDHTASLTFKVSAEARESSIPTRRSAPDPHHIPTEEELEEDPLGNNVIVARRRMHISRQESAMQHLIEEVKARGQGGSQSSQSSSNVSAHPGDLWGQFEEDEPWGVNQATPTTKPSDASSNKQSPNRSKLKREKLTGRHRFSSYVSQRMPPRMHSRMPSKMSHVTSRHPSVSEQSGSSEGGTPGGRRESHSYFPQGSPSIPPIPPLPPMSPSTHSGHSVHSDPSAGSAPPITPLTQSLLISPTTPSAESMNPIFPPFMSQKETPMFPPMVPPTRTDSPMLPPENHRTAPPSRKPTTANLHDIPKLTPRPRRATQSKAPNPNPPLSRKTSMAPIKHARTTPPEGFSVFTPKTRRTSPLKHATTNLVQPTPETVMSGSTSPEMASLSRVHTSQLSPLHGPPPTPQEEKVSFIDAL